MKRVGNLFGTPIVVGDPANIRNEILLIKNKNGIIELQKRNRLRKLVSLTVNSNNSVNIPKEELSEKEVIDNNELDDEPVTPPTEILG